jgi:hypothetical protein
LNTDLSLYGGSAMSRATRSAARTVSRHNADGQVRSNRVDVETDVSLAKIDCQTALTGQAMTAITRVALAQKHLEMQVPEASGRLALIADDHALACVETIGDHRRALRRL